MTRLIDTSLWIDFTRARSPHALKQQIAPYLHDPQACFAEPIAFELLRYASDREADEIAEQLDLMPVLPTPADLWARATDLGRACRRSGVSAGSIDLVIAAIAIYHDAELITFDGGFRDIGRATSLKALVLNRREA